MCIFGVSIHLRWLCSLFVLLCLYLKEQEDYLLQLESKGESPKGTALFRPNAGETNKLRCTGTSSACIHVYVHLNCNTNHHNPAYTATLDIIPSVSCIEVYMHLSEVYVHLIEVYIHPSHACMHRLLYLLVLCINK